VLLGTLKLRDPITSVDDESETKMTELIGVATELAASFDRVHIISVDAVSVKVNRAC
jgi:hypothetical protein